MKSLKNLTKEEAQIMLLSMSVGGLLFVSTRMLMDELGKIDPTTTTGTGPNDVPSFTGNPFIDQIINVNPANPIGPANRNLIPAIFWANRNIPGVRDAKKILGVGDPSWA